ncbi:MAG TPA: HAMP domain-containing sensor histidine kinase [Puia sp.]|nr:HAMP domain-containing sensor histidine kinase [Puia sp.]
MNRRGTSILLMVLTIGAIVVFQVSWLRKNYEEEKRIFTIRTNLLFRETLFKLQAARLHLDTSLDIRVQDKSGLISMTNVLKDKLARDSSGRIQGAKAVIISLRHERIDGKEDSMGQVLYRSPNEKIVDFLTGVDSLQDSITVKDLSDHYKQTLIREGIPVSFRITMTPVKVRSNQPPDFFPSDSNGNRVTIGFAHPAVYELNFDNLFWFMARRVGGQALFSLVLVSLTTLSFLWLYRNWQQQRKLTELKNDFISNITHELKTPIATVSVAVEALKNFSALQDPLRTAEYLDISAHELQRLSLLVDKVLKLSLFERQEIELKKEEFDLKMLVEEVTASMRLQFEKSQAKLTLGAQGSDFQLKADKLHITSVIFNLLDNALKYSRIDPAIQIEVGAEPELLTLSVTDNGVGIPLAYRHRIFEKFFRVPTGDRHNVKGYGLGLSYVSYVLQRQGGRISVDSEEGIGSRFIVKIPRENG